MGKMKQAAVQVLLVVEFEDEGVLDLKDQAIKAARECIDHPQNIAFCEVIGPIKDKE